MTAIVAPPGDRYLELVRENPLTVIRSEDEYERAIATLDRLSDRGNDRTVDETEYLLALASLLKSTRRNTTRSRRFQASTCCAI